VADGSNEEPTRDRRIAIVAIVGVLIVCALVLASALHGRKDRDAAKGDPAPPVAIQSTNAPSSQATFANGGATNAPAGTMPTWAPPPGWEAGASPPPPSTLPSTLPSAAVGAPTVSAVDPATKPAPSELPRTPSGCVKESSREVCGDGVDNNCNGQIDEGCPRR
jgi:hypothetical protein